MTEIGVTAWAMHNIDLGLTKQVSVPFGEVIGVDGDKIFSEHSLQGEILHGRSFPAAGHFSLRL